MAKTLRSNVCDCLSSEYNIFLKINNKTLIFSMPLYLLALMGFSLGIILGILALYNIRYASLTVAISSLALSLSLIPYLIYIENNLALYVITVQ